MTGLLLQKRGDFFSGGGTINLRPRLVTGRGVCFWCLWCLFEAEIDAIHAEQLKELKQARP